MLMTHYLYEILAAALALLTLPLIVELAILTIASRLPRRGRMSSAVSTPIHLAVIIPAHNEEALIGSCIESLQMSAAGDPTRIIAIAHNCSDRTAERAAQAGAEVVVYDDPQAKGKGCALAHGFAYASSQGMDASLIVDADSTVSPNLIAAVRKALANGAEAVQCRYEMDSSSKRPTTRLTSLAFRGFNVVRPAGRDRLGLSAGILGNGFAVRQTVVANNSYNSHSVVEDLEFHIRLVLAGRKVQFLDDAKVSSALPSTKQGETTQRSRWEGGRANAARTWLGPLLKQVTRGRLRALEPALDLASLPIGYGAALLMVAMILPLAWIRTYALLAVLAIACHVLVAAWSGTDFAGDMRVLARAPGYILWKLFMLPTLVRSSRTDSAWVRTEREPATMPVIMPAIILKTTADAQGNTVKHAVGIATSLETS
jgi:cellulose synthase/poly-beta-1,6-N-acetylglucosamine synthase-like glycosyltransferase